MEFDVPKGAPRKPQGASANRSRYGEAAKYITDYKRRKGRYATPWRSIYDRMRGRAREFVPTPAKLREWFMRDRAWEMEEPSFCEKALKFVEFRGGQILPKISIAFLEAVCYTYY